ncbi:MAG: RC-LH1 core complex protein PufX [Pseudomonadota bacterium]
MAIIQTPDKEVQTSFTAGQIFGLMMQGAFYAALVLFGAAAFVVFFWVVGRLLPPEEAYFSAIEQTVRAFV